MKNIFTLLLCTSCLAGFGQNATQYSYATGTNASLSEDVNGGTVDMSSGTTQVFGSNSINQNSSLMNIGFTFIFMGSNFTQFAVTSNGVVSLGAIVASNQYGNSFPLSSTAVIAPYWQNIETSASGQIHYKLFGSFPTRVLVIEFSNMGIDQASTSADGTFQTRLYESSHIVEFVYGSMAVGGVSNAAQNKISAIGISNSAGTGNEFSVNQVTLATTTGSSAIYNTNSSTGVLTNLNSTTNGTRRYFRWTPIVTPAFGYGVATYCANGTNPSTLFYGGGIAGSFTSTPAGLSISSSTGNINLSASALGTYTITNTVTLPSSSTTLAISTNVTIGGFPYAPTPVTVSNTTLCSGGASYLNAVSAGNTINWYTVSTGGTSFGNSGSGVNYSVTPPVGTTSYYAESVNATGCVSSTRNAVSITVSAQPVAGALNKTPNNITICTGGNLSATLIPGSGGAGTITDVLEYRVDAGIWQSYISGTAISSSGHSSVDIRTYRTATGSACSTSTIRTASWAIVSIPVSGVLTSTPSGGSICSGTDVSATSTTGSGGAGTVTDILQYRYDGGSWTTYVSGNILPTTGHTSVDIRTYRTATASYCTTSTANIISWAIAAQPVSGILSPSPATGPICSGNNVSAAISPGSGGTGTVTDVLEYRYEGGSWLIYTAGNNLPTTSHSSIDIRTYRTATGSNCNTSSINTVSWSIVSTPVSGSLTPTPATGNICPGSTLFALATNGSGGTGTVTDVLQYRFDGGSWVTYTSGTVLSTTGYTLADIRTYRTATGTNCTASSINTVSWNIVSTPVSGSLTPTPAPGTICSGNYLFAVAANGSGGAGTITDVLEYRFDGGSWLNYTSGTTLLTTGHISADIRTYRTATGTNCSTSPINSVSWTIGGQPVAGTLSALPAVGKICSSNNVSATFSPGSGGVGTVNDVLQYSYDGGSWNSYISGTVLITSGHSSVNIRTYRTATGSNCSTSSINTVSWTITEAPSALISYSTRQFCMPSGHEAVIFSGTAGGTYSAIPSGLSIDNNGTVDFDASLNGTYTVKYTIAASGGCSIYTVSTVLALNNYEWTGVINSDWNNAGNWTGGSIPSATCPLVVIPLTSVNPVISTGTAWVNSVQIDPGAYLTIKDAKLQIGGSITSNRSIIANNGIIEFNGTRPQFVGGDMFVNKRLSTLVNNNVQGIQLSGSDTLLITNAVLFGDVVGSFINTNNLMTLVSCDTATARIGPITNDNKINGNMTIERYIPNHSKAWQLLCSPAKGQTIKDAWQEGAALPNGNPHPGYGTMLTGSMSPALPYGFDATTSGNGSIKVYDNSSALWLPISSTFIDINNNKGFILFVRGDRSVTTSSASPTKTILRATGSIYQPTDPAPDMYIPQGKFESIANPYPSAINFAQVGKTGGVADIFYIWDPKISGDFGFGGWQTFTSNSPDPGYSVTPGGGSYANRNTEIESGTAFLAYAPYSEGTLTFSEACKTSVNHLVTRQADLMQKLNISLNVISNESIVLLDGVMTQYDPSYSNNKDKQDAPKVAPGWESLSILSNNYLLGIEKRQAIASKDTIRYYLGVLKKKHYMLEINAQKLNKQGRIAIMEDTWLHKQTSIDLNGITQLLFDVTEDPGSFAAGRFRLIFHGGPVVPNFTSLRDIILEPDAIKNKFIRIYPNPVKGHIMQINFGKPGTYLVSVQSLQGQVILSNTIKIKAPYAIEKVLLPLSVSNGLYMVCLTSEIGEKTYLNIQTY